MKQVPCRSCKRLFDMPNNYQGTILCEACDPMMQDDLPNKPLIEAYREMLEIAGAMAQILETRVAWEHAGEILNRYQEAIK